MSPLILRPELHKANHLPDKSVDPAWLADMQNRCRAAQTYLADKPGEPRPFFEDLGTLVYEDIPILVQKLYGRA